MKWVRGFSLMELMAALSIVAILSVLSISSLRYFWRPAQAEIFISQLIRAIHLTRSEAILRREKVILCGSSDQQNCSDHWQDGYIVKTAERVVYHFKNTSGKGILHWRSFPAHRPRLEFLSTGWPHAQNGTFWFCPADTAAPAWAVVVNKGGRTRIVKPDRQGNVRDGKGKLFVC